MNFFNRAFEKVVAAREEQAQRYVNEFMADRGFDFDKDILNPRG
nr:hypothetical protein [uncultured Cohaesibacter sp.]